MKEGEDHKLAVMKVYVKRVEGYNNICKHIRIRNSSNSLKYLFWSSIFPKICLISRDLARSGSPSSSTITRRIDSATESQQPPNQTHICNSTGKQNQCNPKSKSLDH
ncbi:hypothetical protein F8388_002318 [Cannabis sativa]|uniref:Uncharacterized protein n=1 Tax=Cannabis sativa TaxID=3483 RepID=A0A7J6EF60_CANSA|nr:hypothetical protein F8388_002318 [Cannabis sativa]